MEFYSTRRELFSQQFSQLSKKYNTISLARFIVAVAFLVAAYYCLTPGSNTTPIIVMTVCAVAFIVLMRIHTAISQKRARAASLVKVNEDELNYLSGKSIVFANGAEFVDHKHPYSHDLDIFGPRSLFHNLNRTETYKGQEKLAGFLLNVLPQPQILQNQKAIKELAAKPGLRQEIMALGKNNKDNAQSYQKLKNWVTASAGSLSAVSGIIAIAVPVALLGCILAYVVTGNTMFTAIAGYFVAFNFLFMLGYVKIIKNEIVYTGEIHDIIHRYSLIIEQIEDEEFTSHKLKDLQQKLINNNQRASSHIKKLALLFSRMDIVNNVFGATLLNSILLFHYHVLRSLLNWKKSHAQNLTSWLDVIAETEALGSLANLYYNNPDFTFPQLNSDYHIKFKDLGHPLIKKEKRVGNDVNFDPAFTILTGSNMSGKSTFLRSLGINMVLAGTGAPVCAAQAVVHPLQVLVSMRLSDSLSDSESYFFAEIKRLREIMDALQGETAFVLLDEILRGTNSDDKRTGTIKVVKRMIGLNAIGAIATHDIEVCNTAYEYPEKLINRCFEVQIVDNELYFDYQLRDGICRNKSATFIMEKMGVV